MILLYIYFSQNDKEPVVSSTSSEDIVTSAESSPDSKDVEENDHDSDIVYVDVKGEVHKPGIYEMSPTSRVNDVIEVSGGFTDQAEQTAVNLAQKVVDEMVIIVPTKDGENLNTPAAAQNDKVRINDVDQAEIETLTGIGPSKAQAIIQYREEHGQFQQVEDLLNVSGIGEKTLENIEDDIQVP